MVRLVGAIIGLAALLCACTDSKEVNAAFSQNRVSWFVFDKDRPDGLDSLPGFEQAMRVTWQPRNRAVWATDVSLAPGKSGAVAITGLGLLILDDSDGTLRGWRPGFSGDLDHYRTDRLFVWRNRLFMTLAQEPPGEDPPVSLVWWAPDQTRLALYPIPSQLSMPSRQLSSVLPPESGSDVLIGTWKQWTGKEWLYVPMAFDLASGTEIEPPALSPAPIDETFLGVKAKLAERLGVGVPSQTARGADVVVAFSESGWVSVGRPGEERARLYRLPELGNAGRYTHSLALVRGFVFTWESTYRGFNGAAGLVHVPFAVLSP